MAAFARKHCYSIMLLVVVLLVEAPLLHAKGLFKMGDPAPDFTLETIDGQTVSLSQYKGKVVVLGLFHICEPCLVQGTELQKVNDVFKGNPNVHVIDQRGTIRWQRVGTMEIGAAEVIKSEVEKLLPNSKDGGA